MHLTLVVGPAVLHACVWDDVRAVTNARVQLRTMGMMVTPLTSPMILAGIESALTQLAATVDLTTITSVNGAAYPALVSQSEQLRDAFSGCPLTEGITLTKWMEIALHGIPDVGEDRSPTDELGTTSARWRSGWGLACAVLPFLPLSNAAALSTAPGPRDMILLHDDLDLLVLPSSDVLAASVVQDPNGRVGRMLLRDKYANGRWSVLAHLALIFAPGGRIGVDNKRFAFVRPFSSKAGTVRFQHGSPVDEFYDLRANTRCVLEGQVLTYKQAAGSRCPARIILLTDEDNPAIPHLLAGVFDCPVATPLSPTTSTPVTAAGYGCALLVAAGNMVGVRALLAEQAAPDLVTCPAPPSTGATLLTPPAMSRASSFLHLSISPASPPNRIQGPPSPAPSEDWKGVEPWLRQLEPAPADKWECTIYAAMMPEFTRVRALVDSGVIHPGSF